MSVKSGQFTVAAHIMAALGFKHGEEISVRDPGGRRERRSHLRSEVPF